MSFVVALSFRRWVRELNLAVLSYQTNLNAALQSYAAASDVSLVLPTLCLALSCGSSAAAARSRHLTLFFPRSSPAC